MTDFQMGPLGLHVIKYAAEQADDFYDANWLIIDVNCTTDQGKVAFQSPCLMTTDIFDFMDEIKALLSGEGYNAYLVSLEPQVDVKISRGDGPDMFVLDVELTPDADNDEDIYDLSCPVTRVDLENMAQNASKVIEAFPVRAIGGS